MNVYQKSEIIRLRKNGLGYKKIASILSLSTNTVKSFCRREEVEKNNDEQSDNDSGVCLLCKEPLRHVKGKKQKKYCSDSCRMKWWNAHLDKVHKKSYSEHICLNCQKPFQSYANTKRKYCSHRCYISSRFGGKSNE